METLTNLSSYTNIVISLGVAVLFKDIISNFFIGFKFYISKDFNESDIVYFDDNEYLIVKIGIVKTIFQNTKTNRWLYITNDRLKYLKLEKNTIKRKTNENN